VIAHRIATVAAALAVVAAAPAAVLAQDGGNYGRPEQTPENMVRFALFRFSFCAMKKSAMTADKLLSTDIGSDEEAKLVKSLRTTARDCYSDWPGFSPTEVHNSMAEIRYHTEFKSAPVPVVGANEKPPASFTVPGAKDKGTPEQEVAWYLGALANCITFADVPGAHRLVMGPFGVPEETKRFDALKPAIAKCSGQETVAGLTPRLLRGYLAESLLVRMRRAK
jgi:hypothetical protein